MRATLTVSVPEGPNKACKVTLKLWDVPRALLRQLAATCDVVEGTVRRRELLGETVDVVCNRAERSITLVKPPHEVHGLQAQFENLVGRSLAYRLRPLQDAARKRAVAGDKTPLETRLEGCSIDVLFNNIYQATRAAAQPPAEPTTKRGRKLKSTKSKPKPKQRMRN